MEKKLFTILGIFLIAGPAFCQNKWEVPDAEKENVSILMFDEDMASEGRSLYENSCKSCHGTPTQADFSLMLPSPGDAASELFQSQTDGEMFYKIKTGRGSMPKFEDTFGQDEVWSLIAHIRSFNKNYVQPKPNLEGIVIPDIRLQLLYDENVDKLVVKTLDSVGQPMLGVEVKAFVKGTFGNYLLGKAQCNKLGIAYFDVDAKLPGDEQGNIPVIVKATKGYGTAKVKQVMAIVEPVMRTSVIAGRHLWSTSKMAPIWLKAVFMLTVIGIWGALFYIVFGLKKLKNYK